MKRFNTPTVRTALLALVIAIALTGLYSAGAAYIKPQIGRLFQANYFRQDVSPGDRRAPLGYTLARPLPQGWQADWSGGKLWITHYNPDGSVADALPFDSLESLYVWFETHPDCCDVDVDKLMREAPENVVPVSTVELVKQAMNKKHRTAQ
ncbi:MAG: hypothetical protein ACYSWW_17975 [Planctomycetota bacterium]